MRATILLLALCLPSCKDKPEPGGDTALPEICNAGTSWSSGTVAFADATDAWGLSEINPEGTRVIAVDFDNDGWTDLAIRRSDGVDDFSAEGTRYTWLLRNTGQGSFEDVTEASGITATRTTGDSRPGHTWAFGDVDGDGDLDVFTGLADTSGAWDETSELMLGNGDGTFSLGPEDSDLRVDGETSPAGASFVDVDRDGNLDLWVTHYYLQDYLYLGNGGGSFEKNIGDAGLRTTQWSSVDDLNDARSHTAAWSALACDLNNDGAPELLSASYGRAPNHLWLNTGSGVFENRSIASGYAFDDRVDWSDNESARCWCMLHRDDVGCDDVPEPEAIACNDDEDAFRWDNDYDREPFRLGGNSGGTTCADVDNDGWMDLVTSEIVHWDVGSSSDPAELMVNTHDPDVVFERPGADATGILIDHDRADWNDGVMSNSVFDFDNDGWPDIYLGNSDYPGSRGLLFHQVASGQFEVVDTSEGIDHYHSHGSAVADFDRDGDLDIVVGYSTSRCDGDRECYDTYNAHFFENQLALGGNFIQLKLVGTAGSNSSAIGAVVSVAAVGVTQTQDVEGGHGHYGQQDDLVLHFGLGVACEADVEVRWPDADLSTQSFTVGGGYRYQVVQGSEPTVVE